MSTEDIIKVIAYSQKRRDVAHDNAMRFEEDIADFEGKLGLTNGERVILDHIASKLHMYNSEFHKQHYSLVHCMIMRWNSRYNRGSFMIMTLG